MAYCSASDDVTTIPRSTSTPTSSQPTASPIDQEAASYGGFCRQVATNGRSAATTPAA